MPNLMMDIRKKTAVEELDYTFLMDCLKSYKSPRAKLTSLLEQGDIVRIKKGLYLFDPEYRLAAYSPEIMANKIYGPSYVSCEYALSFYGLIPEYVAHVTSVSTKRTRHFDTPIGRFSYFHVPLALYKVGFCVIPIREHATALMAAKEKALADLLILRAFHPKTQEELLELLFDDLRLDEDGVRRMKIGIFRDIFKQYSSPVLKLLIEWLQQ